MRDQASLTSAAPQSDIHDQISRWLVFLSKTARLLLGSDFLINGICWWWKILPYPNMYEIPNPQTPAFVLAMIDTHFMYTLVKGIEVVTGLMLLLNAWTPLALVIMFPITIAAWSVDFFVLSNSLRANVLGWGTLFLNSFLLLVHLDCYRPMLALRSQVFERDGAGKSFPGSQSAATLHTAPVPIRSRAMIAIGGFSVIVGVWTVLWLAAMIVQRI